MLFFKSSSGKPTSGSFSIWRIPLDGGIASKLPGSPENVTWVSASPDGRKLVLTLRAKSEPEVLMLKTAGK